MTIHLFNNDGILIREGKNLAFVIRHAKNRGVKSISAIYSKNYKVSVVMTFNDDYYIYYTFASIRLCDHFHSKRWNDLYKPIDL